MGLAIKDVEDAIVKDLQELEDLADVCKNIQSYGGELEALLNQVAQLTVSMPAVYILYAGSDFSRPGGTGSYDDIMSFSAAVIAKNLRGRDSLRVGIYEILEILKTELVGNDLGIDIEPFEPESIRPVMMTDKFSVYVFTVKTNVSMD